MIDIIIPTYNAHNIINKTLLSIAFQNIKDKFNVYIVDDCSEENYDKEIEIFSDKLNIKQLRMPENSGPGATRQYGIDNSNGDYIVFIDSDDLFYNCFSIESLYNAITSGDYDGAIGIMIDETSDMFYEYTNHSGNLHGKMYKRKFLVDNNIRFNNSRSSEDNSFNQLFLLAEPKVVSVEKHVYLYRFNDNSITQHDSNNYPFYSIESYIQNMVWVSNIGLERNYDINKIAELIFCSYMFVFQTYSNNIRRNDLNLIFKWVYPLHNLYKQYNGLLSYETKREIMIDRNVHGNVECSLREFYNLVELYNNSYV